MTKPTLAQFRRVVPILDDREFALACRVLGVTDDPVGILSRTKLLTWEYLVHLGFVSDAQRRALLGAMLPALCGYQGLLGLSRASLPTFSLAIAEQRWASWPRSYARDPARDSNWYDLDQEENVRELPAPAVCLFVLDLTAAWVRAEARLARLEPAHAPAGRGGAAPPPG